MSGKLCKTKHFNERSIERLGRLVNDNELAEAFRLGKRPSSLMSSNKELAEYMYNKLEPECRGRFIVCTHRDIIYVFDTGRRNGDIVAVTVYAVPEEMKRDEKGKKVLSSSSACFVATIDGKFLTEFGLEETDIGKSVTFRNREKAINAILNNKDLKAMYDSGELFIVDMKG